MNLKYRNISLSLGNIINNDNSLLCLLYFISYGLILFNKGIFWDGWILCNANKDIITVIFHESGAFLGIRGIIHNFFLSFNNILLYRITCFLAYLISAILLNKILKNVKEITSTARFFIVLIFALFPVNSARIALINIPTSIFFLLFFLGFWLITKFIEKKNIVTRIVALCFLFLSFNTYSILVFYSLVILYLIYISSTRNKSLFTIIKDLMHYTDFIVMPVVYWLIRNIFYKPSGAYEGYNSITLQKLIQTPSMLIQTFNSSFLEIFRIIIGFSILNIIGAIIIMFCLQNKTEEQSKIKNDILLFFLGIFSFIAGVFPYVSVGLFPCLYDWDSRHQLLVPLGAGFIIYYGLKLIIDSLRLDRKIHILLCSVLIALFINMNFRNCIEYQMDWYKQVSLIENFKASTEITDHTTFLFEDHTPNAKGRSYRPYEYAGLMKYAFGNEERFGMDINAFKGTNSFTPFIGEANITKDYKIREPEYKIIIEQGNYYNFYYDGIINRIFKTFKLMFLEYFSPKKFREYAKQIIIFKYDKL